MNLSDINRKLEATGSGRSSRPGASRWCPGTPAEKLRGVNLAIERNAWGAFETEFYPTYDFRPVWQGIQERAT